MWKCCGSTGDREKAPRTHVVLNYGAGEDSGKSLGDSSQSNSRRSNQSILKEINPEYSSEGLLLKLKLQYFGHLMQKADLLEKTLMLGKIEGRRRRGQQRMRWLVGITNLMDMNLCKLREIVKDRKAWWVAVRGITRSQTGLSN